MSRLEKLKQLRVHAWYGPIASRVGPDLFRIMYRFIEEHDHLNSSDFVDKINATFVRGGNKDDAMISELLTVVNFEGYERRRS